MLVTVRLEPVPFWEPTLRIRSWTLWAAGREAPTLFWLVCGAVKLLLLLLVGEMYLFLSVTEQMPRDPLRECQPPGRGRRPGYSLDHRTGVYLVLVFLL